ncbi:MAG TPA: hypothetical protein VE986_10450 [Hyphomicrobiales bacterium]|nr:hypothetical protein [Hyphomicrobiales bacterium]
MGFIRAIISLAIILIIVVFGYWLYASYVSAPNAPYWAEINKRLPDPLRRFSCDQVRKRNSSGPIESCEGA